MGISIQSMAGKLITFIRLPGVVPMSLQSAAALLGKQPEEKRSIELGLSVKDPEDYWQAIVYPAVILAAGGAVVALLRQA